MSFLEIVPGRMPGLPGWILVGADMGYEEWKDNILSAALQIADESYQRASWFGSGDRVSSPEELYCLLFDDFMFEDFIVIHRNSMTREQFDKAVMFMKVMDEFSNNNPDFLPPEKVIQDEGWREVRLIAKDLLDVF